MGASICDSYLGDTLDKRRCIYLGAHRSNRTPPIGYTRKRKLPYLMHEFGYGLIQASCRNLAIAGRCPFLISVIRIKPEETARTVSFSP